MTMPSPAPVVTPQQLLDDITLAHAEPLWDTVSGHGSAIGPNCSTQQWGTASRLDPGTSSLVGIRATFPWIELFGKAPKVNADVEIAALGLATLSKSTGVWTPRILHGGADLVAHGYVWSGDPGGLLTDTATAAGNRAWGWNSHGAGGSFGDARPDQYAPGGQGHIRAHGWPAPWPGQMFWCSANPNSDSSLAAATNTDVAALLWWITVRVVGPDAATAPFLLMPGVDLQADGASNTPAVGTRPGFNGRARRLGPQWQTLTGHTASAAQLAAHPPVNVVPGYTVPAPPIPPPVTPPAPVDVTHKVEVRTQFRTDGGPWKDYTTGGITV